MNVFSQLWRCLAGQSREDRARQFKTNRSLDRKPVQLTQNWRDMFPLSGSSGAILHRLNFPEEAVRHAVEQFVMASSCGNNCCTCVYHKCS